MTDNYSIWIMALKLVRNTQESEKRASHRKTTAWPAARTNLFNSYEPALVAGTSSIISYTYIYTGQSGIQHTPHAAFRRLYKLNANWNIIPTSSSWFCNMTYCSHEVSQALQGEIKRNFGSVNQPLFLRHLQYLKGRTAVESKANKSLVNGKKCSLPQLTSKSSKRIWLLSCWAWALGMCPLFCLFIPIDCKVVSTSYWCPVGWKWMTLCFLGSL